MFDEEKVVYRLISVEERVFIEKGHSWRRGTFIAKGDNHREREDIHSEGRF